VLAGARWSNRLRRNRLWAESSATEEARHRASMPPLHAAASQISVNWRKCCQTGVCGAWTSEVEIQETSCTGGATLSEKVRFSRPGTGQSNTWPIRATIVAQSTGVPQWRP
jgi:hypothetical protein